MGIESIIQIRQRDIHAADMAFAEFMSLAEDCLNNKAKVAPKLYKDCFGTKLEVVARDVLKEVAPQTPFRPEDIILVSGAKFPDIQAGTYYGVEVKSTKGNSWTSTGSSIVESTRIEDISKIYMLFGKLGGIPAEFRCRPYEQCLSNVAVTHAPRYLIDMTLADSQEKNLFDRMRVDYETFRLFGEKEKIHRVREYYKQHKKESKGRGKFEMPWWIGEEGSEEASSILIRFFTDVEKEVQNEIKARMFVLFKELFRPSFSTKYKRAALWLCSRYSVIDNCLRDKFSAGGKISEIGGVLFEHPLPQVINTLYEYRFRIVDLLQNPDEALIQDIEDYWEVECNPRYFYNHWLKEVQGEFDRNPELQGINVRELFYKWGIK